MIDVKLLEQKVEGSKLKRQAIYDALGISRWTWDNRMDGSGQFKLKEIQELCELLRLTAEERDLIFFAQKIEKISTQ